MGRPAYSREAIVRALLLVAHPDVAVPSAAALIRHLRNNLALRALCGFEGKIPSQQVFCEVYKRLAENPDALEELSVALTDRVKDACPDFGDGYSRGFHYCADLRQPEPSGGAGFRCGTGSLCRGGRSGKAACHSRRQG